MSAAVPPATGTTGPAGLREEGAILLVSLYELGHQPLGLAGPLGFLRQAGFSPATLDLFAEKFADEPIAKARAIFVSVPMHTALRLGVRFLSRARAINPRATIGFYGLYATLNEDHLLEQGADAILGGECEAALVALCQAIGGDAQNAAGNDATSEPSFDLTPGQAVDFAAEGPPPLPRLPVLPGVSTATHRASPTLARLPFVTPSRAGLVPLASYAHFDPGDGGPTRAAGYVEASRGCLHLCRHCPIPPVYHGRFFVVPEAVVLADVAQQVAQGARHITFGDPDFLNGPGHALKIARALHRDFPALTFDVTVKIEHILRHRQVWPELFALGCRFVVSAVESLSQPVLDLLRKGHTAADVAEALHLLRAAGLYMRPSLLAFTPLTTLYDYLDLLFFAERQGLHDCIDPVQFTIRLLVPPGSYLLDADELRPYLGALDPERLSYTWRHPDPRMDALHQAAVQRVNDAMTQKEPPRDTLLALRDLALRAFGTSVPLPHPEPAAPWRAEATASQAPRLTEPWFC